MVRFATLPFAAVVLLCSLGIPSPAVAQETAPQLLREAPDAAARQSVESAQPPQMTTDLVAERPPALLPLYVSFVTLQALDAHSTRYALDRGAVEANPLMKGLAANEVGLLAIKAAGTAGVILASERMWKRNRAAAVVFMIASNSAMAWVVQHNYRAVR